MSYHVCSCETFMRHKDHFIKVTHDGSWSCDMQAYKMMSEVLFLQILIVCFYLFVQANCNTAVYMAGSTTGVYEVHLTKSKEND